MIFRPPQKLTVHRFPLGVNLCYLCFCLFSFISTVLFGISLGILHLGLQRIRNSCISGEKDISKTTGVSSLLIPTVRRTHLFSTTSITSFSNIVYLILGTPVPPPKRRTGVQTLIEVIVVCMICVLRLGSFSH